MNIGSTYKMELYNCGDQVICHADVVKAFDGTYTPGEPTYPVVTADNVLTPWIWVLSIAILLLLVAVS